MPFTKQTIALSCSQVVKARGFKSLKEFSELSGFPVSTLQDWFNTKPDKFDTILEGTAVRHGVE